MLKIPALTNFLYDDFRIIQTASCYLFVEMKSTSKFRDFKTWKTWNPDNSLELEYFPEIPNLKPRTIVRTVSTNLLEVLSNFKSNLRIETRSLMVDHRIFTPKVQAPENGKP